METAISAHKENGMEKLYMLFYLLIKLHTLYNVSNAVSIVSLIFTRFLQVLHIQLLLLDAKQGLIKAQLMVT